MALDHSLIGEPGEPSERSWTSADALLYAVGCGAFWMLRRPARSRLGGGA